MDKKDKIADLNNVCGARCLFSIGLHAVTTAQSLCSIGLQSPHAICRSYFQSLQNGSSESCESASTSSIGSNNSHNNTSKAPGAQLQHKNSSLYQNSLTNANTNGGKSTSITANSLSGFPDFTPDLRKQVSIEHQARELYESILIFNHFPAFDHRK